MSYYIIVAGPGTYFDPFVLVTDQPEKDVARRFPKSTLIKIETDPDMPEPEFTMSGSGLRIDRD